MAMNTCSSSTNNIIARLTERQQHLSKFSSSNSLITLFVKNLHRQTFVPYSTYRTGCYNLSFQKNFGFYDMNHLSHANGYYLASQVCM